jgi:hypothetical protein
MLPNARTIRGPLLLTGAGSWGHDRSSKARWCSQRVRFIAALGSDFTDAGRNIRWVPNLGDSSTHRPYISHSNVQLISFVSAGRCNYGLGAIRTRISSRYPTLEDQPIDFSAVARSLRYGSTERTSLLLHRSIGVLDSRFQGADRIWRT